VSVLLFIVWAFTVKGDRHPHNPPSIWQCKYCTAIFVWIIIDGCLFYTVGIDWSTRCYDQTQLLHPTKHDPSQQKRQCAGGGGGGVFCGRSGSASCSSLEGPCRQQYYSTSVSGVLTASFEVSAASTTAINATPVDWQDRSGYSTTPVTGEPVPICY